MKNTYPAPQVNTDIKRKQGLLHIEGDNIWKRNVPRKGAVVMKLNEGDRCIILDTSKVDTIRGCVDYWYQIRHKDTIGRVFGSQTDIKSESSNETQLFLKQNQEKLKCNAIDYNFINDTFMNNEKNRHLWIVIFTGTTILDTLNFREKEMWFSSKEDYNFDGLCDIIFTDDSMIADGGMNRYYFGSSL